MTSKKLLSKTQDIYRRLLIKLNRIENENTDFIAVAENSILAIDKELREIKTMVIHHDFDSAAEEIIFFREVKPLFVSHFIFRSMVLKIESELPFSSGKAKQKYFTSVLERYRKIYSADTEFLSYCRRGATYLDHKYFLRNALDLKLHFPDKLYDLDHAFSTLGDHMVAGFLAIEKLEKYISERISGEINGGLSVKIKPLEWSGSKASLVELLYALHHTKYFNAGNISMAEVIKNAEVIFGLELENHRKILHEIKSRKILRAKFLHQLTDSLEKHFLENDL